MTTFRLSLGVCLLCFTITHSSPECAYADTITLYLDSDQSTLQLSATYRNANDELVHFEEQAPGTLTAHFTGTATVELASDSIQGILINGQALTHAGLFSPEGFSEPFDTLSPADLAAKIVNPGLLIQASYAVRDMDLDIFGFATPLSPIGEFAINSQLVVVSGTRDYRSGSFEAGFFLGYYDDAPIVRPNASTSSGSFQQVGNQYVLTVPVEIPWTLSQTSSDLLAVSGTFQGQIVAVATVPEPNTLILFAIAIGGSCPFVKRIRKQPK